MERENRLAPPAMPIVFHQNAGHGLSQAETMNELVQILKAAPRRRVTGRFTHDSFIGNQAVFWLISIMKLIWQNASKKIRWNLKKTV